MYVFAVVAVLMVSFGSDRIRLRWIFVVLSFSISVCGFIALLATSHPHFACVTYSFRSSLTGGLYGGFPPLVSQLANEVAASSKIPVGLAMPPRPEGTRHVSESRLPRFAPVSWQHLDSRWLSQGKTGGGRNLLAELGEDGIEQRYSEQEFLDMEIVVPSSGTDYHLLYDH